MEDELLNMESKLSTKAKIIIFTIGFIIIISFIIVFFRSNKFAIKKTITYEVGDKISTDVSDYLVNKPYDTKNYKLELNSVLYDDNKILNTVGEYTYRVIFKDTIKEGKIIVNDSKGPIVETMDIIVGVDEEFSPSDFVASCKDYSLPCEYELSGKKDISKEGIYNLSLITKDTYGNKTTSDVKLTVMAGQSLKSTKLNDLTPKYYKYDDWNNKYVVKYAGGLDPNDEDNPRWSYYYKFSDADFNDYLDEKDKGKTIISAEIIAIYNKYHYIIGFACRVELSDGSISYLTNGE